MITSDDFKFHPRDPSDWRWTETIFIIFAVPEAAISGSLYVLARPNLGICHSAIEVHKGLCFQPWELGHHDPQMHLPCPENFSEYTLPNGLSFKAHDARDSTFTYASLDGNCAFEIDYKSICHPFDPHDARDNPLLSENSHAAKMDGYDGWNNGHMEGIGHMTGELTFEGKRYRIDCIDGMDKSWGPRADWGSKAATWVHVTLGQDFSAFLCFGLEFRNKEIIYSPFKFGFVSVKGERKGIIGAAMSAERVEMIVTRAAIQFTDETGKSYEVNGTAIAGVPWYTFNPSCVAYQSLMRFESNGQVGYSHIADFSGLNFLAKGMSDQFSC